MKQTLREKIEEIIFDYKLDEEMSVVEETSIILTAISEALPKKAIFGICQTDDNPQLGIGRMEGYNKAISDIQSMLKREK